MNLKHTQYNENSEESMWVTLAKTPGIGGYERELCPFCNQTRTQDPEAGQPSDKDRTFGVIS